MPRSPTKVKRLFQSHGINSLTSSRGLRGDKDRVLPLRCNDAAEGDLHSDVSHMNITTRIYTNDMDGFFNICLAVFQFQCNNYPPGREMKSSSIFHEIQLVPWKHGRDGRVRPGPAKGRQHLRGFRRRPGVRR